MENLFAMKSGKQWKGLHRGCAESILAGFHDLTEQNLEAPGLSWPSFEQEAGLDQVLPLWRMSLWLPCAADHCCLTGMFSGAHLFSKGLFCSLLRDPYSWHPSGPGKVSYLTPRGLLPSKSQELQTVEPQSISANALQLTGWFWTLLFYIVSNSMHTYTHSI